MKRQLNDELGASSIILDPQQRKLFRGLKGLEGWADVAQDVGWRVSQTCISIFFFLVGTWATATAAIPNKFRNIGEGLPTSKGGITLKRGPNRGFRVGGLEGVLGVNTKNGGVCRPKNGKVREARAIDGATERRSGTRHDSPSSLAFPEMKCSRGRIPISWVVVDGVASWIRPHRRLSNVPHFPSFVGCGGPLVVFHPLFDPFCLALLTRLILFKGTRQFQSILF